MELSREDSRVAELDGLRGLAIGLPVSGSEKPDPTTPVVDALVEAQPGNAGTKQT